MNVLGTDYTPQDFIRRFGNTFIQLRDGSVISPTDANEERVWYRKYLLGTYDEVTHEDKVMSTNALDIMSYAPKAGYFNIKTGDGITGVLLTYRPQRQFVAGLCPARVRCRVDGKHLARAYDGWYVSVAEAAQLSRMHGGPVAVSRDVALDPSYVYFKEARVGTYNQKGFKIMPEFQDEVPELFQKENVCLW